MSSERDLQARIREVRALRAAYARNDTRTLVSTWQAIVRSHRLLDRKVHTLDGGELHCGSERSATASWPPSAPSSAIAAGT